MIEIIAGTFGYYNGRKVIPITKEDGPQQFDPELEARLVKQGVAKYVDEQPVAPTPAEKPGREPEAGDAPADPEYDEDMKLDELKEVAAAYGVDASAMRKKADVIAAIEEAKAAADEAADDDQSDDGEEPLRSAPRIPSDGLRLQEDGRRRPPPRVPQPRRVRRGAQGRRQDHHSCAG